MNVCRIGNKSIVINVDKYFDISTCFDIVNNSYYSTTYH